MRVLLSVLVVACGAAVPPVAVVGSAAATPPRAELIARSVTGDLFNGQITVTAAVRNKGDKKAGASQTAFYLSTDGKQSANDTTLGTVDTKKVKPKHSMPVAAIFPLPTNAAPGSYRVLACADSGKKVKELKETNNCKASKAAITVVSQVIRVSAAAGTGGTVAASGVTGGTCAGTACSFPTPGTGTVTFTPTPGAGYRFGAWTGASCTGYTAGAGNAITFTKPTAPKTCTATFVKQVTVSWAASPTVFGSVAGTATHGTCTASDPIQGTGSCLVDAGVGTVTLTATPLSIPFTFGSWGGPTCNGSATANVMTFSSPAEDKACTANFTI